MGRVPFPRQELDSPSNPRTPNERGRYAWKIIRFILGPGRNVFCLYIPVESEAYIRIVISKSMRKYLGIGKEDQRRTNYEAGRGKRCESR